MILVHELINYLPHRYSAIWVDAVIEFNEFGGAAMVRCEASRPFMESKKIHKNALIELGAQTYAYCLGAYRKSINFDAGPKVVRIMGVKNFKFLSSIEIENESLITVQASAILQYQNYANIDVQIKSQDQIIAMGEIKIYEEF